MKFCYILILASWAVVCNLVSSDNSGCIFPFYYKGRWHNGPNCIPAYPGQGTFCSLTKNLTDASSHWQYCDCVFPFEFNGKKYHECTTVSDKVGVQEDPWCATAPVLRDFNNDANWKYCADCKPFEYKGVNYNKCTTEDSPGAPWCSTKTKTKTKTKTHFTHFTKDDFWYRHEWKYCDYPVLQNNQDCTSPCTTESSSNKKSWCKTGEGASDWKYCDCVFPFNYNGKEYKKCTTDGGSKGEPWCSTVPVYKGDWNYKRCEDCVFPFTYKHKVYKSCTSADRTDEYPWCPINSRISKHQLLYSGYLWKECRSKTDSRDKHAYLDTRNERLDEVADEMHLLGEIMDDFPQEPKVETN